jgi:hypothetical protein
MINLFISNRPQINGLRSDLELWPDEEYIITNFEFFRGKKTMRIFIFALVGLLTACGGAPTPKASAPRVTNKALAPSLQAKRLAKPAKLYIVMGAKGLPDESVLENVFARKSAMAEVGPASGGGTEVSLEGVYCTLKKATRPTDVPKHILPNETEPHGLTSEEAQSLASSTHYVSVSCLPDRELPLRGLPQYAEKIAEGIADVMDGWIHDTHTGRYWPKDAWARSRKAQNRYSTERVIRVLRTRNAQGEVLLATRGMLSFGKPDLIAFPLTAEQADAFTSHMRTMGDLLIDEDAQGSGMVLSMGAVDALLVDKSAYANSCPGGLPDLGQRGNGQTGQELSLVDPDGPQGVSSAQTRFFRRLMIR